MDKLEDSHRDAISEAGIGLTTADPDTASAFSGLILRVLLSIDARLQETNDFYLQNQEERNRPNG